MKKSKFDALVADGEALLKSMTAAPAAEAAEAAAADDAGDEKIAAAAAEADGATKVDAETEAAAVEEPMGKSFEVTTEGGEKIQAVDGTKIVASLMQDNELLGKAQTNSLNLIKALEARDTEHKKQLGELNTKVEALTKSLEALANKPAGRKAVLTVLDNSKTQTGADGKAEPKGYEPREFMAKALEAQRDKRITGQDVAICEGYIGRGMAVPEHLVKRVVGA